MGVHGFISYGQTTGTFTRKSFHDTFAEKIAPYLNPWPLPRSIVILDNAKIHMYEELQELVHSTGALLFFSSPVLTRLKFNRGRVFSAQAMDPEAWPLGVQGSPGSRNGSGTESVHEKDEDVGYGLYRHCGYLRSALNVAVD
jgi:hypothetical protein